ncbi:MAG: response regulator [Phycisphaerae bacterium]
MQTIKILLADDHQLMRDGLRELLERQDDFAVVAEADNGRDALDLARQEKPDIIIMDIAMPGLNGIVATREILEDDNTIRILALSMHPSGRVVSEMLRAGASGYLVKSCALAELVTAVRTIHAGKTYLSPEIAGVVVDGFVQSLPAGDGLGRGVLSDRECEVLQLVAEGQSTKEIAADLNITPKTVDTHRQHIMDKLGIRSIAELTKYAVREGLTPP